MDHESNWWKDIRHFTPQEFASPDTGESAMRKELVALLDEARGLAGVPFVITSGFRSAAHNFRVGGVADSAHTRGLAADIAAPDSLTRHAVVSGLMRAGFRRIGIGGNFVHADVDMDKPWPCLWTYAAAGGGR